MICVCFAHYCFAIFEHQELSACSLLFCHLPAPRTHCLPCKAQCAGPERQSCSVLQAPAGSWWPILAGRGLPVCHWPLAAQRCDVQRPLAARARHLKVMPQPPCGGYSVAPLLQPATQGQGQGLLLLPQLLLLVLLQVLLQMLPQELLQALLQMILLPGCLAAYCGSCCGFVFVPELHGSVVVAGD